MLNQHRLACKLQGAFDYQSPTPVLSVRPEQSGMARADNTSSHLVEGHPTSVIPANNLPRTTIRGREPTAQTIPARPSHPTRHSREGGNPRPGQPPQHTFTQTLIRCRHSGEGRNPEAPLVCNIPSANSPGGPALWIRLDALSPRKDNAHMEYEVLASETSGDGSVNCATTKLVH